MKKDHLPLVRLHGVNNGYYAQTVGKKRHGSCLGCVLPSLLDIANNHALDFR